MIQIEKDLLLADLCARLPYGIKASYYEAEKERETWDEIEGITCNGYVDIGQYSLYIESVKPYLFPLSSMSDKQKREFYKFFEEGITESANETKQWLRTKRADETRRPVTIAYIMVHKLVIEWLLKNHFDINGLIPMGLAVDATGLNIY